MAEHSEIGGMQNSETANDANYEPFEGTGTGFYRCTLCGIVNAPWDLVEHAGCRKCGCTRVKTTNLSLFEKVVQIVRRPNVWSWPK